MLTKGQHYSFKGPLTSSKGHFIVNKLPKKNKKCCFFLEHLSSSDAETANDFLGVGNPDKIEADASNLPSHPTLLMGAVPNSSILWQAVQTPSENTESYYNFSSFAMGLNQVSAQCRLFGAKF